MKLRRSYSSQSLAWFLLMFILFPHTLASTPEGRAETGEECFRADSAESPETREARERMVQVQILARGIRDPRVLEALRKVPRHRFVPAEMQPPRTRTRLCPSASGRPSLSPMWWPP